MPSTNPQKPCGHLVPSRTFKTATPHPCSNWLHRILFHFSHLKLNSVPQHPKVSSHLGMPLTNAEAGGLQKQGRCRGHWAPLQTPSTGHHAVLSVLHLTQSSRSQVRSTELKTGGLDLEDAAAECLYPQEGGCWLAFMPPENGAPRTRHSSGTFTADSHSGRKRLPVPTPRSWSEPLKTTAF